MFSTVLSAVLLGIFSLVGYFFVLPGAKRRRYQLIFTYVNGGKPKSSLTVLPTREKLSDSVIRVLGLNPGSFTLQGSNTYVVGTGRERLLIDSGDGKREYIELLSSVLRDERAIISKVVITHDHFDHIGGLIHVRKAFPKAEIFKFKLSPQEVDIDGNPMKNLVDGDSLAVEGATVQVIHTPGHTKDHLSLFLQEDNAIFTGDCILGEGTATFDDLHSYMESLNLLLNKIKLSSGNIKLYPGHGPAIANGCEHVELYIAHRLQREKQILNLLHRKNELTLKEAVEIIYEDQQLTTFAKSAASRVLKQHFQKLAKDRRIKLVAKNKWRINERSE